MVNNELLLILAGGLYRNRTGHGLLINQQTGYEIPHEAFIEDKGMFRIVMNRQTQEIYPGWPDLKGFQPDQVTIQVPEALLRGQYQEPQAQILNRLAVLQHWNVQAYTGEHYRREHLKDRPVLMIDRERYELISDEGILRSKYYCTRDIKTNDLQQAADGSFHFFMNQNSRQLVDIDPAMLVLPKDVIRVNFGSWRALDPIGMGMSSKHDPSPYKYLHTQYFQMQHWAQCQNLAQTEIAGLVRYNRVAARLPVDEVKAGVNVMKPY